MSSGKVIVTSRLLDVVKQKTPAHWGKRSRTHGSTQVSRGSHPRLSLTAANGASRLPYSLSLSGFRSRGVFAGGLPSGLSAGNPLSLGPLNQLLVPVLACMHSVVG